ncbi:MAG: PQQ-binding-like beta-propeller repeat protein [Planctomycetota bacterium]
MTQASSMPPSDAGEDSQPRASDPGGKFIKHPLRWALAGFVVGTLAIAMIQFNASVTDYQMAFLRSSVMGCLTLLWVGAFTQLALRRSGRRWWLPIGAVVGAITAGSLIQIETLSGEMIPQWRWRFSSVTTPSLQTLDDAALTRLDSVGDQSIERQPASDGQFEAIASVDKQIGWSGFLGNQRDGVVAKRLFKVPTSKDQIETRWNIGIGEGWSSFAVAQQLAVTLEQRGDEECVTAYRLADGQLVWTYCYPALHFHALGQGGPRSTPAIANDRVWTQGATGRVCCLALSTGELIWSVDLLELVGWTQTASEDAITWGRSGSPLLIDGLCVLPLGGPFDAKESGRSLVALDALTGEVRWRAGPDQISYASPQSMSLDGVDQIVAVNEETITGHDPVDGAILWTFDWPGSSTGGPNCATAVAAGPDQFLIGKGYGGGSALVRVTRDDGDWSATARWDSNRMLKTKFNHAVVRDGVAYGISNGALQAVELESQTIAWQQSRRDRCGQGQVILAEDRLIVQTEPGEILIVDANPEAYQLRFRIDALQHKTWNIPTLVGATLLVRNARQAIAFDLPLANSNGLD